LVVVLQEEGAAHGGDGIEEKRQVQNPDESGATVVSTARKGRPLRRIRSCRIGVRARGAGVT
jgi:hypothetical protein